MTDHRGKCASCGSGKNCSSFVGRGSGFSVLIPCSVALWRRGLVLMLIRSLLRPTRTRGNASAGELVMTPLVGGLVVVLLAGVLGDGPGGGDRVQSWCPCTRPSGPGGRVMMRQLTTPYKQHLPRLQLSRIIQPRPAQPFFLLRWPSRPLRQCH